MSKKLFFLFTLVLFSKELFSDTQTSESFGSANRGFQVPGIGFCIFMKQCIVSHKDFMAFEFGFVTARSPGFSGLQISPFYNDSYGPAVIQFAFVNNVKNKKDSTENWTVFQAGALNLNDRGNVFGGQFSIAANNLPDKDSKEYTNRSPNFTGMQISGGMNTAKNGYGLQLGLDMHWIIFVFDSEKNRYISRANNVYGIQFHPIIQETENMVLGLQASIVNKSRTVIGFQGGAVNEVQENIFGFQYGAINKTNEMFGIQAGLINGSEKETVGIQASLLNESKHMYGIQVGLKNEMMDKGGGFQYGALNKGRGEFMGFQFGFMNTDSSLNPLGQFGAYNESNKSYLFQAGILNTENENPFIQIGVYNNASKESKGAQIGFFNTTDGKASFQFGLLNHAEKNPLRWFPLVNIDYNDQD